MKKLNKKHKSKVRRQVDLDLGVKPPKSIIFTSKKIYNRKKNIKMKKNKVDSMTFFAIAAIGILVTMLITVFITN